MTYNINKIQEADASNTFKRRGFLFSTYFIFKILVLFTIERTYKYNIKDLKELLIMKKEIVIKDCIKEMLHQNFKGSKYSRFNEYHLNREIKNEGLLY